MVRKKLKILHTNFNIGWGGQSNRVFNECNGLSKSGHEVFLAVPNISDLKKKAKEHLLNLHTDVQFKSGLNLSDFKDYSYLKTLIDKYKFDVVHTHGSKDSWTGVLASKYSSHKPLIVRTRHNIFPVKTHFLNRLLFKKWTNEIIVICEYLKRDFIERGLANEGHITVIHSGLEDKTRNLSNKTKTNFRRAFNIDKDELLIGMCANFVWYKGHKYFARASGDILKLHQKARFVILGDGKKEIKDEVKDTFKKCRTFDKVIMPGFYTNMPDFYGSCDILVHPALSEGCCNVILEAFSHGVPVVATNVGGIPDMVEDHKTGILVSPKDPDSISKGVSELIENKGLRENVITNARKKFLDEFTVDKMVEKNERLYYKALQLD
ncbi:glycosyltransferase family 4 protein [bacterium]|nr:glycosyltransferase family 4 protein [bacterium]